MIEGIEAQKRSDLDGQVAIVTGGGRGLGRAFAQALAAAGASVAVLARTEEQIAGTVAHIRESGVRAIALPTDVTDSLAVERAVQTTEQQLGPVDLLVNNAARWLLGNELWKIDPDEWWREITVNLYGPFLCARAVLPNMVARHRGRIINVSSGAALEAQPYVSAYGISKTALTRFTEGLAIETRSHGISVFAIDPGLVRTPMNTYWLELEFDTQTLSPELRPTLQGFQQLFKAGYDDPPEPAVELVLSLASGEADSLSGCHISIHDSLSDMAARADEIQRNEVYRLRLST
ncbi:MAG: SDR family oxidoreductase [Anaerolineae bacterium]|nr:SDR family oxidoreductase [Anaerolineae bacterium]